MIKKEYISSSGAMIKILIYGLLMPLIMFNYSYWFAYSDIEEGIKSIQEENKEIYEV